MGRNKQLGARIAITTAFPTARTRAVVQAMTKKQSSQATPKKTQLEKYVNTNFLSRFSSFCLFGVAFIVAGALTAACGSSAPSPEDSAASAEKVCSEQRSKCAAGDADFRCTYVRCMYSRFRDSDAIAGKVSEVTCGEVFKEIHSSFVEARANDEGVSETTTKCVAIGETCKVRAQSCRLYAGLNDSARAAVKECLAYENDCQRFDACTSAVMAPCGNWQ
jgi:hypothetical protein